MASTQAARAAPGVDRGDPQIDRLGGAINHTNNTSPALVQVHRLRPRKIAQRRGRKQFPEPKRVSRFSIADGRTAVGSVEHDGENYCAIDNNGVVIGIFRDLVAATRALPTVTSP